MTLEDRGMSKQSLIEFDGTVTEVLPDSRFRVKLDNGHEMLAYVAGKMRKRRIRILLGDRVLVEMTPYDLDRGRIKFRQRDERPVGMRARTSQYRRAR